MVGGGGVCGMLKIVLSIHPRFTSIHPRFTIYCVGVELLLRAYLNPQISVMSFYFGFQYKIHLFLLNHNDIYCMTFK